MQAKTGYVGMTTFEYLESRRLFGPPLWSINTAEHRKNQQFKMENQA
jgi:hypothetical protein